MPPKPHPRPKLTHFLLLPLVTPTSRPQLEASRSRFAADVTTPHPNAPNAAPPLPAKAVRPVGSLHLTIGVMSLLTPERVAAACELLRSLDVTAMLHAASSAPSTSQPSDNYTADPASSSTATPTTSPSPLTISLTSLTTHSPPPFTLTSSLHALPSPLPPIHHLATSLLAAFVTASLILPSPSSRPLSLHATLLNTIYARAAPSGKNRWKKGSNKFDARAVMERYRGAVWARDVRVERVAICEMGAKEVVGEGGLVDVEYREVASVGLP